MKRIDTGHFIVYITTALPAFSDKIDFQIEFTNLKARTKTKAKSLAIETLRLHGMKLLEENALVFEFERVYETRYDCIAAPEGVRQAA